MGHNKKIYIWLPICFAICIVVGIFIGSAFSKFGSGRNVFGGKNKLDQIFEYITRSYVDTVDVNELVEQAIPEILSQLDPHSAYITAEDMNLTGDELNGHFSGIGVEFFIQNDTVTIVNVIFGGPSDAVGIMPGDRLVSVDDSTFVGKQINNEKVVRTLRGKLDSQVKLGIKRSSSDKLLSFTVTRGEVPVKSVDAAYKISDGIGYVKISKFGGTTYNEFITAIAKLKSQGCESFIIDLQQNTGGYLGAALMMTNEFLSNKDLIVYTEGRANPRENMYADNSGTCKTNQIAVLIDEGSASASEIFAGAIQDNDRGVIVGRRSFGKGLVQTQYKFNDGSAMRLTIARYHTPSGRCIQKAYEKGKGDEYSKDLTNRYLRGEFDSRDSIKVDNLPLFRTLGGRTVYGNDGILADVFVPRDTSGVNSYYLKMMNAGYIREYAFHYADSNREKLKSYKTWEKALEYLQTQGLVENLSYFASQKGIARRPYLIEESRKLLQSQLESLIIRNIFGDEGFFKIYQRDDKTILKAIELLKAKKATPEAVRKEEYK